MRKVRLNHVFKTSERDVNFLVPTDRDMLRSFLGVVGFYKKFIPDFAVTVQPQFNLLKKDVDFIWDIYCQKSFKYVKKEL